MATGLEFQVFTLLWTILNLSILLAIPIGIVFLILAIIKRR